MKFKYFFLALITLSLLSCESLPDQRSDELKPNASGRTGEIILVMDTAQWNSKLGDEIRNTFAAYVPNLSPEESMFKLHAVNPLALTRVLKSATNLIFVVTLDKKTPQSRALRNYFTKSSLEQIESDTLNFSLGQKNEFAKNQEVLYLFAKSEDVLINRLQENRDKLQEYFQRIERKRVSRKLYSGQKKTSVAKNLRKDKGFSLDIPYGYELAETGDDFVWFRNAGDKFDKNVFVSFTDYTSEEQFSADYIAKWRTNISKRYILESDDPESYLVIDSLNMPYITTPINFGKGYSKKVQGWWMTNTVTMGGPFVSYVTLDQETNRIYYIEGFVYSPGQNKREMLRELEVIMHTFKSGA